MYNVYDQYTDEDGITHSMTVGENLSKEMADVLMKTTPEGWKRVKEKFEMIRLRHNQQIYKASIDKNGLAWFNVPNGYIHAFPFEYEIVT